MLDLQSGADTSASEFAPKNNVMSKPGRPFGRAWLRPTRDHNGQITYWLIPERARVVRWIYAEYVRGRHGDYAISQRIPRRYRPFGKSKHWHPNTIRRILTDPVVLGNDLFPAVIGLDLYNRAQQIRGRNRAANSVGRSSRKGRNGTNLLSDFTFCAYCFSRMSYKKDPIEPMLVCSAGRRGYGCGIADEWPYNHIEKLVLRVVEVRLSELLEVMLPDKAEINEAIHELEGERDKTRQQMDRYLELTAINPNLTYVAEQLAPLQRQLVDLDRRLRQKRQELADVKKAELVFKRKTDRIKEAILKLQTDDHRRLFERRSEVHARLKSIIKEVVVAAAGARVSEEGEKEKFDGKPMLMIESKAGSALQLEANMNDPYDDTRWGLAQGKDADEVFPDF